jgi:hypothetical protein
VTSSCKYSSKTFWFHKRHGISFIAEQLLASEEGIYSVELGEVAVVKGEGNFLTNWETVSFSAARSE